ncbi:MAG: hypothetical protein M3R25_14120 [Bacteroidota bacterium]|nr:hypothetical protein [Bacteroidota bacterium]
MIRRLLSYHLAIMMLLTNVGIPVFTHVCHTQGKSWSSAFIPAKSCCSKSKNNQTAGLCHLPESKQEGVSYEARPCCENHSGFAQLNPEIILSGINFSLKSFDQASAVSVQFFQSSLSAHFASVNSAYPSHGPPSALYGRSMLIFQQVFRC